MSNAAARANRQPRREEGGIFSGEEESSALSTRMAAAGRDSRLSIRRRDRGREGVHAGVERIRARGLAKGETGAKRGRESENSEQQAKGVDGSPGAGFSCFTGSVQASRCRCSKDERSRARESDRQIFVGAEAAAE